MVVLGMMSGTSLDGVDMALCRFVGDGSDYKVLATRAVPYSDGWRRRLEALVGSSAMEYAAADVELGRLFGRLAADFLRETGLQADAVASHGHTVFHQPAAGITTQIGDADAIAAATGKPVVWRFRQLDVALGGQGAPLVPLGDRLLFGRFDACLNLGGIANISFGPTGFDVCPCNQVLNRLALRLGLPYDAEGALARRGHADGALLERLDALGYYRLPPPKSLGREWVDAHVWPLFEGSPLPVEDLLATAVAHVAGRVADTVVHSPVAIRQMLVTGGGARNAFLVESLRAALPQVDVVVPDAQTLDFKEAIVFALLGYLRLTGQVNTLRSVTGARCDSVGGNVAGLLPVGSL